MPDPTPPIPLQYEQRIGDRPPWARTVRVLLWLNLLIAVVAWVLITAADVESVLTTGPLLFLASMTLIVLAETGGHRWATAAGAGHCGICLLLVLLVNALGWGPRQSETPFTIIGLIFLPMAVAVTVMALRELRTPTRYSHISFRTQGASNLPTAFAGLEINVRRVQRADLRACAQLFTAVFAAEPWNETWDVDVAHRRLEEIANTPGFAGWLAVGMDQPIGFVLGYAEQWKDGRHFYIKEMCVAADRQRQGVGQVLMQAMEAHVRQEKVTKLYLLTGRDGPAQAFYAKCGFYTSEKMIMMGKYLA